MSKNRLEAFSDGVLAIIITIMVLELHAPHEFEWTALKSLLPTFLSYLLSFIYVGIYWNNHHHLLQAVHRIGGGVLWANLHLLFWLSLVPFVTKWMGESHFKTLPVALYGTVLLFSGIAWEILRRLLVRHHDRNSVLVKAVGRGWQEATSIALYIVGILMSFIAPWVGCLLYALVAAIWFIPDRRIERALASTDPRESNKSTG
jgi:uncharacterized membrane protein